LIEHSLILESTGTGIHVGVEGSWHEGPTSENVTIRYNHILRCGTGAGTIDGACGITVSVGAEKADVPGLNKHILIEGNIIEGENEESGISVSGASDVTIRSNEISGCKAPVKISHSDNVKVYSNFGAADFETKKVR
jgi:nitrous oxidase accessory protein NosD